MNSTVPLLISIVSVPLITFGQSTFALRNYSPAFGVDAPVFDAQGTPLQGAGFLVELWGGATPDSLSPAVTAFSNRRVMIPFLTGSEAGYFRDDYAGQGGDDQVSIFALPPGGWGWLQVRAWPTALGATYEEAVAQGLGGYGESPLFYAQGGTPFGLPSPPGALIGLQSFNLRPIVPEPSVAWLLLAGLPALWWRQRKQR